MPDVRRQVDTVTLDFPGAAFAGDEVVFLRVIAFRKTASERPRFLVSGFFVLVAASPVAPANTNKASTAITIFNFMRIPPIGMM
jgi:hypothetical protein